MPLRFYLDKRLNRYGEAPIRIVWSFNGDRYQTTMGFSIPPQSWDGRASRVTPAEHNHKKTPSTLINDFLSSMEKAVNRLENHTRISGSVLTKPVVKKVVADVLAAGGEFPGEQEQVWRKMLKDRRLSKNLYFEHFKGGKYKLIAFGKDSETQEDVVIYQAMDREGTVWVRPKEMFFSKVTLPDGRVVERFKAL